jgi:CRISPR-associated Csx2 family protein
MQDYEFKPRKRKLITFLGTGNYQECIYEYGNRRSSPGRFIQTALLENLDWSAEDELIVCLSPKSKNANWFDSELGVGLQSDLERKVPRTKIHLIELNDEMREAELWKIFDEIVEYIQDDDQILLDITHSIRYVPIWGLNIIDYLRTIKRVQSVHMFYGNFAVQKDGIAKVENLSYMFHLIDWTNGIHGFLQTGSTTLIHQLMNRLKREYMNRDASLTALKKFTDALHDFSRSVYTCRAHMFDECVQRLKRNLAEVKAMLTRPDELLTLLKPFVKILNPLERMLEQFEGNLLRDQMYIARWCQEKGLIQQSYTILSENLTSAITLVAFQDEALIMQTKYRLWAEASLRHILLNRSEEKWEYPGQKMTKPEKKETELQHLRKAYANLLPIKKMLKEYDEKISVFKQDRNEINHAGFRGNRMDYEKLEKKLSSHIFDFQHYFRQISDYLLRPRKLKALLLLAHPLNEQQIDELNQRWGIEDLLYLPAPLMDVWTSFPSDSSFATEWVDEAVSWVLGSSTSEDFVIVQGEPAAVFTFVIRLQKYGYEPHYAAAYRDYITEQDEPSGMPLKRIYRHAQFRAYPKYEQISNE